MLTNGYRFYENYGQNEKEIRTKIEVKKSQLPENLLLILRRMKRREKEIINQVGRRCEGHDIYYGEIESFISLKAVLDPSSGVGKSETRQCLILLLV